MSRINTARTALANHRGALIMLAIAGAALLLAVMLALVGVDAAHAAVAEGTNAARAAASSGGGRGLADVVGDADTLARKVLITAAAVGAGFIALKTGFDGKFALAIPSLLAFLLALAFLVPGGTDFLLNTARSLSLG